MKKGEVKKKKYRRLTATVSARFFLKSAVPERGFFRQGLKDDFLIKQTYYYSFLFSLTKYFYLILSSVFLHPHYQVYRSCH
jgi:hypothetical protein